MYNPLIEWKSGFEFEHYFKKIKLSSLVLFGCTHFCGAVTVNLLFSMAHRFGKMLQKEGNLVRAPWYF